MWRYKIREIAHYWVDYIKASIEVKEKSLLKTLSKNSNFAFFSYEKNKLYIEKLPLATNNYRNFYQIKLENISIAFIWDEGIKKGNIRPLPFIEVTGQGLNIFWVDIFYFLMKNLNLEFKKYKRVDFCLDLFLNINYFYEKIIDEKKKEKITNIFQKKKTWIETLYFWEKNTLKNKYWISRIYNKIIDSEKKEKLFLYNDWKDEKWKLRDVTRFEFEAREDLCKFYTYDMLTNEEFIFNRLKKSFYSLNFQFFKFVNFAKILEYSEKEKMEKKQTLKNIYSGDDVAPLTIHQEKIKRKLEEQKNFLKYWNQILDEKKLEITKKMLLAYAKKLKNSWFSIEKINFIIENWLK